MVNLYASIFCDHDKLYGPTGPIADLERFY